MQQRATKAIENVVKTLFIFFALAKSSNDCGLRATAVLNILRFVPDGLILKYLSNLMLMKLCISSTSASRDFLGSKPSLFKNTLANFVV